MTTARKDSEQPKPLPAPNSDFYELAETLNAEELGLLRQVRAFMETQVAVLRNYWISMPYAGWPADKAARTLGAKQRWTKDFRAGIIVRDKNPSLRGHLGDDTIHAPAPYPHAAHMTCC